MNIETVAAQVLADAIGSALAALTLPTAAAPSVVVMGTAGTTSHTYQIIAVSRGGKVSAASAPTTVTNGPDTFDEINFLRISWSPVTDAGGYLVYATGAGIIARVAPGEPLSVDDTGLPGDGSAAPTVTPPRVEVGQSDPDVEQDYPAAVVTPFAMEFNTPLGEDEIEDDTLDVLGKSVVEVGTYTGTFEIKISSKDKPQREDLQEVISALFNSQPGRRGSIILASPPLVINGTVTTIEAPIAFSLSTFTWQEEFAFSKRRWLFLDVDAEFQMLVVRNDVWNIVEYQLQFTNDVDVEIATDTVRINDDGSITPV